MLIEKVFEGKQIRTVWNANEEKYYISVVDIVTIVSESNGDKLSPVEIIVARW